RARPLVTWPGGHGTQDSTAVQADLYVSRTCEVHGLRLTHDPRTVVGRGCREHDIPLAATSRCGGVLALRRLVRLQCGRWPAPGGTWRSDRAAGQPSRRSLSACSRPVKVAYRAI